MEDNIDFKCPQCDTTYHASRSHIGRSIKCQCGKILTISSSFSVPKTTTIIEKSNKPPSTKQATSSSSNLKKSRKATLRLVGLALLILLYVCGCFYSFLFPLPIVGVLCVVGWFFSKRSDKPFIKTISGLLNFTAISVTFLMCVLFVLNITEQGNSNEIPAWLLQLDNFLIWSRETLRSISITSIILYIAVILTLVAISYFKPEWEPVKKFVDIQTKIGRVSAILIITTSFTFFAPNNADKTVDYIYYKEYSLLRREKLKQDRKTLIATAIKKVIDQKVRSIDSAGMKLSLVTNVPVSYQNITDPRDDIIQQIKAEAKADMNSAMSDVGEELQDEQNLKTEWTASENVTKETWTATKTSSHSWAKDRTYLVTEALESLKKSEKRSSEVVQGVKAIFVKLFGLIAPEMEELFGVYIEECIDSIADIIWERTKADEIAAAVFESSGGRKGRFNIFDTITTFIKGKQTEPVLETITGTTPAQPSSSTSTSTTDPDPLPTDPGPPSTFPDQTSTTSNYIKRCSRCGHQVPNSSHPGEICPYCGAPWIANTGN